ncbi:hypothetical protein [Chromobacterium paludis]|uniref:Uncharacterized protein n=1 Tax=Chromobacterium paludis TaxID=2605945 RepID=A0A5C1DIB6_9NEIS|nr:hypothetical protein [Chromobacterium paludis]QEL56461.1 hypothetical protein FYK34_13265 [Chromobacterium paludis]
MLSKINIKSIIISHVKTLRNSTSPDVCWSDFIVFYIIPFVFALGLSIKFDITESFVNGVVTAASIFAGLLLNLLVLVYTVLSRQRPTPPDQNSKNRREIFEKILTETFSNISYSILISVVLVATCLLFYIKGGYFPTGNRLLILFLIFQLIITLLMILKRIHSLFENELTEERDKNKTTSQSEEEDSPRNPLN